MIFVKIISNLLPVTVVVAELLTYSKKEELAGELSESRE